MTAWRVKKRCAQPGVAGHIISIATLCRMPSTFSPAIGVAQVGDLNLVHANVMNAAHPYAVGMIEIPLIRERIDESAAI